MTNGKRQLTCGSCISKVVCDDNSIAADGDAEVCCLLRKLRTEPLLQHASWRIASLQQPFLDFGGPFLPKLAISFGWKMILFHHCCSVPATLQQPFLGKLPAFPFRQKCRTLLAAYWAFLKHSGPVVASQQLSLGGKAPWWLLCFWKTNSQQQLTGRSCSSEDELFIQCRSSAGKAMAMASLCYGSRVTETWGWGAAFGCKLSQCSGGVAAAISGVRVYTSTVTNSCCT